MGGGVSTGDISGTPKREIPRTLAGDGRAKKTCVVSRADPGGFNGISEG